MLYKVTHFAGRILANTRPHQLCCGDQEMRTAISCMQCTQMAGPIPKSVETPWKHCLFVQLFLVQLSFVWRSYVAIFGRKTAGRRDRFVIIIIPCAWSISAHIALKHTQFPLHHSSCLMPYSLSINISGTSSAFVCTVCTHAFANQ